MDSGPIYKCWEIMNCGNLECPARSEPETPCWEIAKRTESCPDVSGTCRDCVVYLLKGETATLSRKKLQNFIKQRKLLEKYKTSQQACVLKARSNS